MKDYDTLRSLTRQYEQGFLTSQEYIDLVTKTAIEIDRKPEKIFDLSSKISVIPRTESVFYTYI